MDWKPQDKTGTGSGDGDVVRFKSCTFSNAVDTVRLRKKRTFITYCRIDIALLRAPDARYKGK